MLAPEERGATLGLAWPLLSPLYLAARDALLQRADDAASVHLSRREAATAVLLATPYCYTAWNARKADLVAAVRDAAGDGWADAWAPSPACACRRDAVPLAAALAPDAAARVLAAAADEARFTAMVQSRHPKPGEAWAHRRWLLGGLAAAASSAAGGELACGALRLVGEDAERCERAVLAHSRNYLAWTHLTLCVAWALRLAAACRDAAPAALPVVLRAWAFSERRVRVVWADHSAWHHRAAVLALLLAAPGGPGNTGGEGGGEEQAAALGRALLARERGVLAAATALSAAPGAPRASAVRTRDAGCSLRYHAVALTALTARAGLPADEAAAHALAAAGRTVADAVGAHLGADD